MKEARGSWGHVYSSLQMHMYTTHCLILTPTLFVLWVQTRGCFLSLWIDLLVTSYWIIITTHSQTIAVAHSGETEKTNCNQLAITMVCKPSLIPNPHLWEERICWFDLNFLSQIPLSSYMWDEQSNHRVHNCLHIAIFVSRLGMRIGAFTRKAWLNSSCKRKAAGLRPD